MKKKTLVAVILALAILLGFSSMAMAETSVRVYVNNVEVVSTPAAKTVDQTVFLPFRAILNALGVTNDQIKYYSSPSSLEIQTQDKYIFMAIGNTAVVVDKQMVMISSAPFVENGRTFVPVRAVSDLLGASVVWDAADKVVNITK